MEQHDQARGGGDEAGTVASNDQQLFVHDREFKRHEYLLINLSKGMKLFLLAFCRIQLWLSRILSRTDLKLSFLETLEGTYGAASIT
jgi:hypothetical protein